MHGLCISCHTACLIEPQVILCLCARNGAYIESCTCKIVHGQTHKIYVVNMKLSHHTCQRRHKHIHIAAGTHSTVFLVVCQTASFSLTASGRLLFRLFKLSFWDFSFPNNKNLALKLNKDQWGKLPRKTSATHFPLEYMIRKFIYV